MIIEKYYLRSMPFAQCHVEFYCDDGILKEVRLVSYASTILSVKYHGSDVDITVMYPVDCSTTTARHVNRFTTELLGTNMYHALKKLGGGCTLRVEGEAVRLSCLRSEYLCFGKRFH